MIEQWQELKETIAELRDNDGTGTQQETCKFLVNLMDVLEKQMQEPCEDAISRQDTIDANPSSFSHDHENDLISRQDAIDAVRKAYESDEMLDGYEYRLGELPSTQVEQRWIPVSERWPEYGSEVLVCYDFKGKRSVYIADFYGDGDFHGLDDEFLTSECRKYRKAVAWMPLPEPYKEQNHE